VRTRARERSLEKLPKSKMMLLPVFHSEEAFARNFDHHQQQGSMLLQQRSTRRNGFCKGFPESRITDAAQSIELGHETDATFCPVHCQYSAFMQHHEKANQQHEVIIIECAPCSLTRNQYLGRRSERSHPRLRSPNCRRTY
jgi:hypothetical protein